jgi:hypothetical protein
MQTLFLHTTRFQHLEKTDRAESWRALLVVLCLVK